MTSQEDLLDIIEELRTSNSKLFKEECLRRHSANQDWKDYLFAVYNPFITYGESGDRNYNQDNLTNLKLCRSVNAGITAVTINKAYPGLIPTASKMMKAYDYGKKPKPIPEGFWAGIKYDGNYANLIVTEDEIQFYSSGGHQYTHDIDLRLTPGFVYMAERIHGDGKLGDRRRCALEGPKGAKVAKVSNHYKIFEVVTITDFNLGVSAASYENRRGLIPDCYAAGEIWCPSIEEAEDWLDDLILEGFEGIVMKQPDMVWKDTKSRKIDLCKWKKRLTADLYCIEEIEGEGSSKGIIGSIRLRDSNGLEFNVGSGLSLNGDLPFGSYVGNVVEIEYEHINPEGTYVQPVVVSIRHDKPITDID